MRIIGIDPGLRNMGWGVVDADGTRLRHVANGIVHSDGETLALRLLYRTVDAMWHAAGDTATDHNFYTKRGLLAGVYSATLMCWLNDKSDGFATTWAFLDRRIAEVMRIPKALASIGKLTGRLPDPFQLLRRFTPPAPRT